jgi:LuxR family maltose regulon positive regulatory protein
MTDLPTDSAQLHPPSIPPVRLLTSAEPHSADHRIGIEFANEYPLLQAKIVVPRITDASMLVERSAIIDKIRKAAANQLVLACAPAGYGKTLAVQQAADQIGDRVAWFTLDERDNDPDRFLAYLIGALNRVCPEISVRSTQVNAGSRARFAQLESVMNDLSHHGPATTLVLDDYHRIKNPSVHDMTEHLIDFKAPLVRIIIVSRQRPPLSIARARARGELVEILTDQFRFSRQETSRMLALKDRDPVSDEVISEFLARTEGWAVALRFFDHLTPSTNDGWPVETESAISGSAHMTEYLTEEVFRGLPEAHREFVMRTAILKRLNASLCNAVTEQVDGLATMYALESHGLPIFRTDDEGHWYRYHPLVAEAFLRRLTDHYSESDIAEMHQRASRWYAEHGNPVDSIDHTLSSKSWDQALRQMRAVGFEKIGLRSTITLRRWLDALPAEMRDSEHDLSFWYGTTLTATGQLKEGQQYLERSEPGWIGSGDARMIGEVLKHRAWHAMSEWRLDDALIDAQRSYEVNADASPADRSESRFTHSVVLARMGRIRDAIAMYQEAEEEHPLPPVTSVEYGWQLAQSGRTVEAETTLRLGISDRNPTDPHRRANIWLAEIYRAWRDFPRAEEALGRAAEIKFQHRTGSLYPWLSVSRARFHWSNGEFESAIAEIDRSILAAASDNDSNGLRISRAVRSTFLLWQGRIDETSDWAKHASAQDDTLSRSVNFEERLAYARYLVAVERPETALSYLSEMFRSADADGRVIDAGRVLIARSLAWQLVKRKEAASRELLRALTLLEPSGHLSAFTDEGESLIEPLRSVAASGKSLEFIRRILAAVGETSQPVAVRTVLSTDRLSRRELEVLRLISVGMSNRQISDQLYISVPTVKRHVSTIFQKLEATSRTGAVSAGRALQLI